MSMKIALFSWSHFPFSGFDCSFLTLIGETVLGDLLVFFEGVISGLASSSFTDDGEGEVSGDDRFILRFKPVRSQPSRLYLLDMSWSFKGQVRRFNEDINETSEDNKTLDTTSSRPT